MNSWVRRTLFALSSSALALSSAPLAHAQRGASPRTLSLPSGPGSVEGLGSSFEPSPQSGGASYSVPFAMPQAVGGFVPSLSLSYAAGGGATEVGHGWSLPFPSIRRRTEDGIPRYDNSDTFAIAGGGGDGDLVSMGGGVYRLRFEGAFVRVRRDGDRWEARQPDGITHWFGEDPTARDGEGARTSRWLITRSTDRHGHEIRYEYTREGNRGFLSAIRYGGEGAAEVRVELQYEARPDVLVSYQSGDAITLGKRLRAVRLTRGGELVATYSMAYATDPGLSRLESVTMTGTDGTTALPTLRFGYGAVDFSAMRVVSVSNAPGMGLASNANELVDLNGDGASDLLVTTPGRYTAYLNEAGERFGTQYQLDTAPSVSLDQSGVQVADMDGDASIDIVAKVGVASDGFRFYPGGNARSFGAVRAFSSNRSYSFEDPEVRLVDLDFDRRTDVLFTTPSGMYASYNTGGDFTEPAAIPVVDPSQTLRFNDPNVRLADMNGDRLQDLVYLRSGSLVFWPSRGRGLYASAQRMTGVPEASDTSALQLVDLTGDGLTDIVRVGVNVVEAWIHQANGSFSAMPRMVSGVPERTTNTTVRFVDMNGNGSTDILWVDVTGAPTNSWRYLDVLSGAAQNQLTRIDNGLGLVTQIRYRASAAYAADDARAGRPWSTRLPNGMMVVSEIVEDVGLGVLETTRFNYHEGLYDGLTREYRGFGRAEKIEVGDEQQPTLVTALEFDHGVMDEARKGMLLRSERRTESGAVFDRTTSSYEVVTVATGEGGVTLRWARSRRSETAVFEQTMVPKVTRSETDYDEWGNVVETREFGLVEGDNVAVGNDERVTRTTYAINEREWLLRYLATEELRSIDGGRLAMRRRYLDGEPFVGLPVGQITRGNLTREEVWVGPGDRWIESGSFRRDTHGNSVEEKDGDGRRRLIEWDSVTSAWPVSEAIPFADGRMIRWQIEHDRRLGVPVAVVMPNGSRTEARYDALGRRTAIIEPGDSAERPTVRFGYELGASISRVETAERVDSGTDNVRRTISLVDGMRRERARLVEHEEGGFLVEGWSGYGPRGLNTVVGKSFRVSNSMDAVARRMTGTIPRYDALGRVRETLLEDGSRTRTEIEPFVQRDFDANDLDESSPQFNTPETALSDGLGRTIERRMRSRDGDVVWRYRFDPRGNLVERTDPVGVSTRLFYDGLSRATEVIDPNGGRRTTEYDAAGNTVASTNARGQRISWRYDEAGRPIEHDSDGDGVMDTRWENDRGCSNAMGRLCRLVEPRMTTEFEYDLRGRITENRWVVNGATYTARNVFDALGRVRRHVYPDGSSVDYEFNQRGMVSRIPGILDVATYTDDGQPQERRFTSGIRERRQYDARFRWTGLGYVGPAGQVLEDTTRTLDRVGLIMGVRDGRPDRTAEDDRSETYEYNDREQLVKATGRYGEIRWRWDAAARLLERTSTVAMMNLGALTYPMQVTDAQPHGARRAGRHTLEYDADGNVRSFDGRPFRWDARNYNVELSDERGRTEESWYDQGGMRRIRQTRGGGEAEETTVFLSPAEELRNGKLVRYVLIGDEAIWFSDRGNPPQTAAPRMACNTKTAAPEGLIWVLCALLALRPFPQRVRRAVRRSVWWGAMGALVMACNTTPGARPIESSEGTFLLRGFVGETLALATSEGVVSERDVRFPGGVLRSGPENARQRRFSGSQPQATKDFAFIGPRVLMMEMGVWLSPASVWLGGGDESPYSYGDGDFVSRVDSSGHSWTDAILHYTERALTHVANGMERATQVTEVVAGVGIPAVSQVAGAFVGAVRGTQAATGTAFDGRTLTRAERIDAAVSAVGGIASAAGAGRAAAALNVVAGGTSAVVAASRGDRVGAALGVVQAVVGARGLRGGSGAPRASSGAHPRSGQSKAIRAGCGCFVGSVTVDTPSGPRAIETIRVGDVVYAKNERNEGEVRARKVVHVFVRDGAETLEIDVCSGTDRRTIETTDDHPFWIEGRGWIAAEGLWPGATLANRDGRSEQLCGMRRTGRTMRVYNLTVEGDHTFFVLGGTWVHNADPTCYVAYLSSDTGKARGVTKNGKALTVTEAADEARAGNNIWAPDRATAERVATKASRADPKTQGGRNPTHDEPHVPSDPAFLPHFHPTDGSGASRVPARGLATTSGPDVHIWYPRGE